MSAETRLTPFLFEGNTLIRTVNLDDEKVWMVAKDVAEPLGYKNPREAIRLHCKHGKPVGEERNAPPSLDPQTVIIPEADVFRLIFRSRLPAAQRFEAWVMEEVLPAIRRTGSYGPASPPPELSDEGVELQSPDGLKLRKVNTVIKAFGERAGQQLWVKLGLEWVPAMAAALKQADWLDDPNPPGTVTVTVTPNAAATKAA